MKFSAVSAVSSSAKMSPSMRREWIEIIEWSEYIWKNVVSLHAEGVD